MSECLGCQKLEQDDDKTATLVSGVVVCDSCQSWRDECLERHKEAKKLLTLPLKDRRDKLAKIIATRGELAAKRLKDEMVRIHANNNRMGVENERSKQD